MTFFIGDWFNGGIVMEDGGFSFETGNLRFDTGHIGNYAVYKFCFAIEPLHFTCDAKDAVFVFMKSVERKIVAGNKVDDQACAYSYCQSKDVDGRICFLPLHDAPGEQ